MGGERPAHDGDGEAAARCEGPEPLASRRRILHVAAPARFGGLESVLVLLAATQAAAGHDVRVALVLEPRTLPHPVTARLRADGVPVVEIVTSARAYAAERQSLAAHLAAHPADVVHLHGHRPDVIDAPVARAAGAATVSTAHGFIVNGIRGRLTRWLHLRALRRMDAVVAVSDLLSTQLREAGVDGSRLHDVPNAFAPPPQSLARAEARHRLGLPASGFVVGFVGRLSAEKGPDIALAALAALAAAGDRTTRLAVVGAGREADALRAGAVRQDLHDRVHWCGAVAEVGLCYAAFDAFLLSSRTEGTPMALLEAMAAGVPAIATRVGGVAAVLDDDGVLVDAGDPGTLPARLAAAVAEVRARPEVARERAERGRARILARYDPRAWLARYDDVYARAVTVAARRGGRPPVATAAAFPMIPRTP